MVRSKLARNVLASGWNRIVNLEKTFELKCRIEHAKVAYATCLPHRARETLVNDATKAKSKGIDSEIQYKPCMYDAVQSKAPNVVMYESSLFSRNMHFAPRELVDVIEKRLPERDGKYNTSIRCILPNAVGKSTYPFRSTRNVPSPNEPSPNTTTTFIVVILVNYSSSLHMCLKEPE